MIEENRELQVPGDGIVRDPGPPQEHMEFPRYMTHDSYRPAKLDKEHPIKDDAGRTVGSYFHGAEAQRFQPVLAMNAASRDEHLSYGYKDNGKMDPAAFQRAVSGPPPSTEAYKPIEYPKYHYGKTVFSRVEEEEHLIELGINADGSPRTTSEAMPALDIEVNTLETFPSVEEMTTRLNAADRMAKQFEPEVDLDDIDALETKLAELRAKKARAAELKAEIARLEAEEEPATAAEITEAVATEAAQAPVDELAAKKKARSEAIKAGVARAKAKKAQEGSKAA